MTLALAQTPEEAVAFFIACCCMAASYERRNADGN